MKPRFGKWTRVEDALPEFDKRVGDIKFASVIAQSDGIAGIAEYIEGTGFVLIGANAPSRNVDKWMPLPAPDEDAFTELRALLDEILEDCPDEYFNGYFARSITSIREVIGE